MMLVLVLYPAIAAMTAIAVAISFAAHLRMHPMAASREAVVQAAFAFTMLATVLGAFWPITWIVLLCGYLVSTEEER